MVKGGWGKLGKEVQYIHSFKKHRKVALSPEYTPSGEGGNRSPSTMPHHLQNSNGCQGAPKWLTGSTKGSNPKFLDASVNFCYISILIQVAVLREKVVTENGMEWKITSWG